MEMPLQLVKRDYAIPVDGNTDHGDPIALERYRGGEHRRMLDRRRD